MFSGFGCESVFLFCLFFIDSGVVALIFLTIGVGFSGFTISGITEKNYLYNCTTFLLNVTWFDIIKMRSHDSMPSRCNTQR